MVYKSTIIEICGFDRVLAHLLYRLRCPWDNQIKFSDLIYLTQIIIAPIQFTIFKQNSSNSNPNNWISMFCKISLELCKSNLERDCAREMRDIDPAVHLQMNGGDDFLKWIRRDLIAAARVGEL